MEIKIKKIHENAKLPKRGSEYSAGADLYACLNEDIVIPPGKTAFVSLGIQMEIPEGYAGFVFARSGLASKEGLAPANKVGVVDSDYRGNCMVAIHNQSDEMRIVRNGDRIAQLVIMPVCMAEFIESDELSETGRGGGGFGSTGKR